MVSFCPVVALVAPDPASYVNSVMMTESPPRQRRSTYIQSKEAVFVIHIQLDKNVGSAGNALTVGLSNTGCFIILSWPAVSV